MKKWKIKDFILIGLLAAIYGAIVLLVGAATAAINPILHLCSPGIVALAGGTIIYFVVNKIRKFGALSLLITVGIILFSGFSGMMYLPLVLTVSITAIVMDIIITKNKFNTVSLAIGYGLIQAAYIFGGCIPVLFFLEENIKQWQDAGMDNETIQNFVDHSTGWFLVGGMAIGVVGGIIGLNIGSFILKKHFSKIKATEAV